MSIRSYKDLLAWQRAFALAGECYRIGDALRRARRSGLATQIERAADSVHANIAEGHGRLHRGDYLHHLSMASGSLAECESRLLVAQTLPGADEARLGSALTLAREVGRLLGGLIRALRGGSAGDDDG